MLSLVQLYYGWSAFWISYFVGSLFFPSEKGKTRPIAKITNKKVVVSLIRNCLVTSLTLPVIYFIPQTIWLPNIWYGHLLKYALAMLLGEIWFYYSHRLMHHKWFYKWHSDHHAFIQPYALAGLYCSWVEMILVNYLAIWIPFQLLGFSILETCVGSMLIALNVLKGHAGLQLYSERSALAKWIIDWIFSSETHDLHHEKMTANFGLLYLLDRIHGTYIDS